MLHGDLSLSVQNGFSYIKFTEIGRRPFRKWAMFRNTNNNNDAKMTNC